MMGLGTPEGDGVNQSILAKEPFNLRAQGSIPHDVKVDVGLK
jgi:hypothetical protein